MTEAAQLTFRLLAADDLPLICRWLNSPHLREFFQKTPIALDEVTAKYAPRIDGEIPILCHVAMEGGRAFGYLQCYRNADWPEWAETIGRSDGVSLDLYIGEESCLRRGLGRAMLGGYVQRVAFRAFADVDTVYIAHNLANTIARVCSEAVGFKPVGVFLEDGVCMSLLVLHRCDA